MKSITLTMILTLAFFAGCSKKAEQEGAAEKRAERIRYVSDEQTAQLGIPELSREELLEFAGRRDLSPQNLALILDRLSAFPGDETVRAAIPFIDRRENILLERLNAGGGKEEVWILEETGLGKVAIGTLRKITGEKLSSGEAWLAWYQDYKSQAGSTEEKTKNIE
ncbi:MAG: hypothetical protein RAO92_00620 [Candidatus Euphemobacter frigidus]|nr:hypothetical protein [Candidatus Euphemobacter frigidus]MDP8274881.1 hypothetical protein [Candidatus Euphemobacter frigidus]